MPYNDWKLRIEDILEAIAKIDRYTVDMTFEDFVADEKTADAVLRNLQVIGEASRNMPEDVRTQLSHIPWDKMRGIRNVLIHEYFGINLSIIWQTIKEDLPPLVSPLREIMSRE